MRHTYFQILLLIVFITAFGCASKISLVGRWENVTEIIDAGPSEVEVVLKEHGSGGILFDDKKYFWPFRAFKYHRDGEYLIICFVLENGQMEDPEKGKIIRLTETELIVSGEKDEDPMVFRRLQSKFSK